MKVDPRIAELFAVTFAGLSSDDGKSVSQQQVDLARELGPHQRAVAVIVAQLVVGVCEALGVNDTLAAPPAEGEAEVSAKILDICRPQGASSMVH
jgi:hypothetical protein